LALNTLGGEDVVSSDELDLALWTGRVCRIFAAIPRLLSFSGVDVEKMMTVPSMAMPFGIQLDMLTLGEATAGVLFWYIVPVFQLLVALVVADAFMYCLHRLEHTNKWLYSTF
jgi:sterol desaturase/sphingolipid hydroxylase (fatty acid hydroxylase superfamily)